MRRWSWRSLALMSVTVGAISLGSPPVAADTFESGSYIIPMDIDYQDDGMLRAYGLVYELLRNGVPIRWVIQPGKGLGGVDFTASATDFSTSTAIATHGYRGGPFVIDAFNAPDAEPIITDWQAVYPETTVHEATEAFSGEVARYLVVAPTIAMVADGNEDIARGYMQAAAIPDSTLSLDWADQSPDMLDVDELSGPTEANHRDGLLFDADGDPVYCQLMSMHWGVNDAEDNPEVVAEVREYLNNPVHFYAECQAVNAFENLVPHGFFLTPNGFEIGPRPDEVDYFNMDSPFAQLDGPFETVGGSEPSYSLLMGDMYKAGDITMLTEAGTPEGVNDVWMTGFLDGACPPSQHECGTIGKVSYLGGHEFRTDTPISENPDTQGTRMFLNSLFEAPCATLEGLPTIAVAVDAPATTLEPQVTLSITYVNTSFATALNAVLSDPLPAGATFVSASNGGTYDGNTVTWQLGNLGPDESGDLTVMVELDDFGTYTNMAHLDYQVGLNTLSLDSNTSQTIYGTTPLDSTAGSTSNGTGTGGSATGVVDGTSATATAGTTSVGTFGGSDTATIPSGDDSGSVGCACHTTPARGTKAPWLLVGVLLFGARRRRRWLTAAASTLGIAGCASGSTSTTDSAGGTGFGSQTTINGDTTANGEGSTDKLDLGAISDTPFVPTGCQKIDFLFVIDSSESMKDHQANLVASFPGFVQAMEQAVAADDWHVMVVDTDAQWNGADCANACATLGTCPDEPAFECSTPPPELCDITVGAGEIAPFGEGASNTACELDVDERFINSGHPDLASAFTCVAQVGVDGSPAERTAQALVRAVSADLSGLGGCNEGFLREDAILVITLITDEPDEVSPDDPQAWHDAIVAAKNGDDNAVVLLGLLPDADTPAPLCADPEAAPRLAMLLDAFPASTRASVCEADYSPFLANAVDVIADTCEGFNPPG